MGYIYQYPNALIGVANFFAHTRCSYFFYLNVKWIDFLRQRSNILSKRDGDDGIVECNIIITKNFSVKTFDWHCRRCLNWLPYIYNGKNPSKSHFLDTGCS